MSRLAILLPAFMLFAPIAGAQVPDAGPIAARIAETPTLSAVIRDNVADVMHRTTARTKQGIQFAAERLSTQRYTEIAAVLLHRLDLEMGRDKPNTQVARSLARALEMVGSADAGPPLLRYAQTAQTKARDPELSERDRDFWDRTRSSLLSAERALRQAPPYPSLFDVVAPNAEAALEDQPAEEDPDALPAPEAAEATNAEQIFAQLPQRLKRAAQNVLDATVTDFYGQARRERAQPNPPTYTGRDRELRAICQGLSRLKKGHILLTGKAGVGKTTLLRMLMDAYLDGRCPPLKGQTPLIFELPITLIATRDLTILDVLSEAQAVAAALDRDFIFFVDEAHVSSEIIRHALKAKLTELLDQDHSRLHLVWATTSSEARELKDDSAFSRRWLEVHVKEFDRDQTLAAVTGAMVPRWRKAHGDEAGGFRAVEEAAFDYAFRYGYLEQPHAGQPTSTEELLEGAIIFRRARDPHAFELTVRDIQDYLRFQKNRKLVPGDPEIEERFTEVWNEFDREYRGAPGFKAQLKKRLRTFFSFPERSLMEAYLMLGPPGGGKTFAAELIAKHFFEGAILRLNGADYKEAHAKSRIGGAPPGYVGFKERVSEFAKFFADNPHGGVIKLEEADYVNQDILQLLTNMITDRVFRDAHGHEYRTDHYIIIMNTNIGQELLVPPNTKNKLDWAQYEGRRAALLETVMIDGQPVEVARQDKVKEAFDQFVYKVVTQSQPAMDTSLVAQEAVKQKRRYKPFYVLSPDRAELEDAARTKLEEYTARVRREFDVRLTLAPGVLERLLDLDAYDFEKGFTYVNDQLEDKLFAHLQSHLAGATGLEVRVSLEDAQREVDGLPITGQDLVVDWGEESARYPLDGLLARGNNPWARNQAMRSRIDGIENAMAARLKGQEELISRVKSYLDLKLIDWNARLVFTLLGTSGNGKTEFAKALALTLFGDEGAYFKVSGLNNVQQLNNVFRSDSGFIGSNEVTAFEEWFKSRRNSGGGVILLDELLSFHGLTEVEVGNRLAVLNRLYDMLDEGLVTFKGTPEDARGFVIVITGNALQEFFDHIGDSPEDEDLVQKVLANVTESDILSYFLRLGLDAPKVARLGEISLHGPLPRDIAQEVGQKMLGDLLRRNADEIGLQRRGASVPDLRIEPRILTEVVDRVRTVRLGMRRVNRAITRLVSRPLAGVLGAFPHAGRVEARLLEGDRIAWFADDVEVALVNVAAAGEPKRERWVPEADLPAEARRLTPQLADVQPAERVRLSPLQINKTAVHEVYGHWMTAVLLSGENPHEMISIIPNEGSLGRVRRKTDPEYTAASLSTLLKEILYLEAGHRALFVRGVYAVGGGTSDLEKKRHDDMAKVNERLSSILGNQLVTGHADYSGEEKSRELRRIVRDNLKPVADKLVQFGLHLGVFEPIYQRVLNERFVKQEVLDQFMTETRARLPDPDKTFLFFLDQVWGPLIEAADTPAEDKRVLTEVLEKVTREVRELRTMRGDLPADLGELIEEIRQRRGFGEDGPALDCERLLVGLTPPGN